MLFARVQLLVQRHLALVVLSILHAYRYIVVMTYVLPKLMLLQELYALQILVEEPRFISESR